MEKNNNIETLISEKEKYDKRKKIYGLIFWIVAVIATVTVTFSVSRYFNKTTNSLIYSKDSIIVEKDSIQRVLSDSLQKAIKDTLKSLNITLLQIEPKAYAEKSNFDSTTMMQMYNFYIYLKASNVALNKIDSVHYFFDHPTFKEVVYTETDSKGKVLKREVKDESLERSITPIDSFKIKYHGWGVLSNVPIYLYEKNSKIDTINFKMFNNLEVRGIVPKVN